MFVIKNLSGMTGSAVLALAAVLASGIVVHAADEPAKPAAPAASVPAAAVAPSDAGTAAATGATMTALERIKATEKGKLKNPFTDNPEAIAEGKKLYLSNSCNGCHGGGGGGGMCPPLTNEVWVYGSDDDALFRLVILGTKELQEQGYSRKGREGVVGPMPGYADIITKEDDMWKIIAFIRSVWNGDPKRRNW